MKEALRQGSAKSAKAKKARRITQPSYANKLDFTDVCQCCLISGANDIAVVKSFDYRNKNLDADCGLLIYMLVWGLNGSIGTAKAKFARKGTSFGDIDNHGIGPICTERKSGVKTINRKLSVESFNLEDKDLSEPCADYLCNVMIQIPGKLWKKLN